MAMQHSEGIGTSIKLAVTGRGQMVRRLSEQAVCGRFAVFFHGLCTVKPALLLVKFFLYIFDLQNTHWANRMK